MQATGTAAREWKDGWPLVLASMLGLSFVAYATFSLGIVMAPLQAEFGWSRGEISTMIGIQGAAQVGLSPIVGYCVDRFGPRRIALPGMVIYALLLATVALAGPGIASWYVAWGIACIAWVSIGSPIWTKAVAGRFDASRGLALSVTLAGHGIAMIIVPLASVGLLEAFGWRGVYVGLAALGLAIGFPGAFVWLRNARDQAVRDGTPLAKADAALSSTESGYAFGEIVRQSRYWRLAAAMLVGGFAIGPLQTHFVPIMTDAGATPAHAALILAMLGPATIAGRLLGGFLMDRVFPPLVAGVTFALPAAACLLVAQADGDATVAAIAIVLLGLALGAEIDTIAVLSSRYFGLRCYGKVYAPLTGIYGLGVAGSSTVAGYVYDAVGSYDPVLFAAAGAMVAPVALLLTLGRFPIFPTAPIIGTA